MSLEFSHYNIYVRFWHGSGSLLVKFKSFSRNLWYFLRNLFFYLTRSFPIKITGSFVCLDSSSCKNWIPMFPLVFAVFSSKHCNLLVTFVILLFAFFLFFYFQLHSILHESFLLILYRYWFIECSNRINWFYL